MHTSMEAGPMIKKGDMKSSKWISAYENNNVDIGLNVAFQERLKLAKGMWAAPDEMKQMVVEKILILKLEQIVRGFHHLLLHLYTALHYHQDRCF